MKGYPKHYNTREDVMVALEIDPVRAKAFLEDAITHRDGWYITAPIASEAEGLEDDAHRVIDQSDADSPPDWYQQEYGPLPGNILDRLGISVEEAEALLS